MVHNIESRWAQGDADVLVPETILERPGRRLKDLEKLIEEIMSLTEGV